MIHVNVYVEAEDSNISCTREDERNVLRRKECCHPIQITNHTRWARGTPLVISPNQAKEIQRPGGRAGGVSFDLISGNHAALCEWFNGEVARVRQLPCVGWHDIPKGDTTTPFRCHRSSCDRAMRIIGSSRPCLQRVPCKATEEEPKK